MNLAVMLAALLFALMGSELNRLESEGDKERLAANIPQPWLLWIQGSDQ